MIDPADAAEGRVAVIAPEGFMEEATSENIMAGGAMLRRAALSVRHRHGARAQGPDGQRHRDGRFGWDTVADRADRHHFRDRRTPRGRMACRSNSR